MQDQATKLETIVVRKIIPATSEEVFQAWTDPESIRHWMCPGDVWESDARLDVRPGGSFHITMKGKEKNYEHSGVYRVVNPPSTLVFTWISKGTHEQETVVTIELQSRGKECELTLTHEKLPGSEAAKGHTDGWTQIVNLQANFFSRK